ncbi:hypothetical protein B0H14DRAFT_2250388, partial [Mycena olivaceomarginata]
TNDRDLQEVTNIIASALPTTSACAAVQGSSYQPPAARNFTAEELRRAYDCINRQNYIHALVHHPVGSIVEYPETGASKGVGIAHKFSVDPENFCHPKESFQYSLGDSHGG